MAESSHVNYFAITERFELVRLSSLACALASLMWPVQMTDLCFFFLSLFFIQGKMASLFFSKVGVNLFYIIIAVYLYGDLAIYGAAVSKSLRDVACQVPEFPVHNSTTLNDSLNVTDLGDLPCWQNYGITRGNTYRIFLLGFLVVVGPFTFFNVQKTKYLQIFTTLMRWIAFASMIVLCAMALIGGRGQGHPPMASFAGLPALFGVCVYSFMCHHSLPSLVTPWRDKRRLFPLLAGRLPAHPGLLHAALLHGHLHLPPPARHVHPRLPAPLPVLSFPLQPNSGTDSIIPHIPVLQYFLSLFPVFTLSTNFPIIAITLRNNLRSLFLREEPSRQHRSNSLLSSSSSSTAGAAPPAKPSCHQVRPLLAV
ncbi:hypothetical protein HPB48_013356 [Haemaphysalis longicornis]|uniref:Uncharacterized protein n=1 Tax=Haemaphysalis longicornis TaxID=44386 RepID=A0A9J6FUN5_HAELO|nr:hypothetical protein HPB48_013356 [Haemaphysalis longicornis]